MGSKTSNAARSHRSAWHEKEVKKRKFLQGCASLRSPKMNATNNINNKKERLRINRPPQKNPIYIPSSDLITKKKTKHNFARFYHQLTSIILYYYIIHLETNPRISLKEKKEGSNNICNYYLLQNISEPAVPKRKKKKKRNSWLFKKKKKKKKKKK